MRNIKGNIINNKYIIISTYIFGLLAYMFIFTNLLLNHDSVGKDCATGATISSGRWGLYIFSLLCPPYLMPWFIGIISLSFIAIANCFILSIFRIDNPLYQVLISGITTTFPSLLVMYCYIHTAIPYSLSFLLSTVSIYLYSVPNRKRYIIATILTIISLSIYQGYLSMELSLFVTLIIKWILDKRTIQHIIKHSILILGCIFIAVIIYYSITIAILYFSNDSFNNYAEQQLNSSTNYITRIVNTYWHYLLLFTHKYKGIINTNFSMILHFILIIISIFCYYSIITKCLNYSRLFFLTIIIIIYPITTNIYEILTPDSIYAMLLSGFIISYIFVWLLLSYTPKSNLAYKRLNRILIVCFLGILLNNIYISNKAGLKLYLSYQNAYSYYTAMISHIHLHPDFTPNTNIAIIGTAKDYIYDLSKFSEDNLYYGEEIINAYSRNSFIKTKLGFNANFIDDENTIKAIKQNSSFIEMPNYPYKGSIQKINDILVIKLNLND